VGSNTCPRSVPVVLCATVETEKTRARTRTVNAQTEAFQKLLLDRGTPTRITLSQFICSPSIRINCTFLPLQAPEPHRHKRSNSAIQAQTCCTECSLFAIANSRLCLGFSATYGVNRKLRNLNFDSYGGFSEFRFRYL
jgi:hypothetical protein